MNKETEIKLRASAETLAALREHPLLKKRNKSGWQRRELFNQYYDSPGRELAQARVALRIRRDGEQFIQTLKSRGQSVAGLSERNEWEWPLPGPELDLRVLDDACWPAALAGLDKTTLQPLFSTDFVREFAEIAWGRGKARVVIEAALDQGEVRAAGRGEPIGELELELRQGAPAALLELAAELAAELPLMPCDISKAERGYRLIDPQSYAVALPAPELNPLMAVDDAFAALAWHLLGSSQRLAEQYRWSGHWALLEGWLQQLVDLRALLGSLGQVVPRASSRVLREALDELLRDWRPRVANGREEESLRHSGPAWFAEELQRPRWGAFSLQASRWLLEKGWQQGRSERGGRQAAVPLGRWLQRQLAEEAQALPLTRYETQPAALGEQLPRLERLLVWLRLARGVLELPDRDRLYGELNKLATLAVGEADEPRQQQRVEQLRVVLASRGWKALR